MARKRKKKKGKAQKKSSGGKGEGTDARIWAACITGVAAVLVAIVSLAPRMFIGAAIGIKVPDYRLELSRPAVQPGARLADGRFIKPPVIEVVAKCVNCLDPNAIHARCGKLRDHEPEGMLPFVPREYLEIVEELGGHILHGDFKSQLFIADRYRLTPHGRYQAQFSVFDPCKPKTVAEFTEFNYIYLAPFGDMSEALSSSRTGLESTSSDPAGLRIETPVSERMLYAYLRQRFDFTTNFCISGFFTIQCDDSSNPCSFDVSVGDRWVEKVSVIFADGPLNAFTIRVQDESKGEGKMRRKSDSLKVGLSTSGHTVRNYFRISFCQYGYKTKCSVFFRPNGPISAGEPAIHERLVDLSAFSTDDVRIHLKLWKAGVVEVYDFVVAETPPLQDGAAASSR